MVMNRHSHDLATLRQPSGEIEIVATRFEIARRMVVKEQNPRSPVEKRLAKEGRGINRSLGTSPEGQLMVGKVSVATVEAEETEDLPAFTAQSSNEKLARGAWLIETLRGPHLGLRETLSDLEGSEQGCGFRWAETGPENQLTEAESRHPGQPSGLRKQTMRLGNRAESTSTGAQKNCNQLGVGERRRTVLKETLTRPL